MKTCQPRTYITGSTSIEILTFLMEDGETYDEFMEAIKNMYPGAEIRIPEAKKAEVLFLKKLKPEFNKKEKASEEDFWTKVNEEDDDEIVPRKKKKK